MNKKTYMSSKKWSKEEDNILYNKYSSCDQKEIISLIPGRTWGSISTRAIKKLGLSRNLYDWKPEEDRILKKKYKKSQKQDLLNSLPKRTWQGIQSRAIKVLGLSRNIRHWNNKEIKILSNYYPSKGVRGVKLLLPNRSHSAIISMASILKIPLIRGNCDMSPLLSYSPISMYWLGFLLADGHFVPKLSKCSLRLANKDKDMVYKFASFVSSNDVSPRHHNSTGIDLYSKEVVPELCRRFSIQSNKTCNPPNLSPIEKNADLMLSILIGLIDGDGHIYHAKECNASYMALECHSKWISIYQKFSNFLVDNFKNNGSNPRCYLKFRNRKIGRSTRTYLRFSIYDNYLMKAIKREAIRMKLPFMKRKWDKVDLNFISEREQTPRVMATVKKMFEKGFNKNEIISVTGYTLSRVRWAIKKLILQTKKDKIK